MRTIQDSTGLKAVMMLPVAIVFKHSTQCPISANAQREVRSFMNVHTHAPIYLIDVLQSRPVSQEIERLTGIRHESPQVIVFQHGAPVWHASHYGVSAQALEEATVDFK